MRGIIAVITVIYLVCCINCLTLTKSQEPIKTLTKVKQVQVQLKAVKRQKQVSRGRTGVRKTLLGTYSITAYYNDQVGTRDNKLVKNYSCAAWLPFGTKVYVEGIGIFEVCDITAKWIKKRYDGKIIDLYFGMDAREKTSEFGVQKRKVFILEED